MKKTSKLKRILAFILGAALVTLCVFLIIQAVWYGNLDHALQLERNGFYKDDVTMLTFGQSAARVCCWIFGIGSGFVGLGSLGVAFDIIDL